MTNSIPQSLRMSLDGLQLPRSPHLTTDYDWIIPVLEQYGRTIEDAAIQINNDVADWQNGATPSDFLEAVITAGLEAYHQDQYSLTGTEYLEVFRKISSGGDKWRGCEWWDTRLLLSKTRVIGYLQREEGYSASQIVRMLAATDTSLHVPFQAIQCISSSLGSQSKPPKLNEIDKAWKRDSNYGDSLFADSSLEDSLEVAGAIAKRFVPDSHIETYLKSLVGEVDQDENAEVNWPYFQILYWLSLIVEYYDHPAGSLYEFSPRGKSALHTFDKFKLSTGNPILNNAKATASLSREWALNRGAEDAHALVALIETLESIPHFAGTEIARILRAWVVRTLALYKEERKVLVLKDPDVAYTRLVEKVAKGETYTHGVVEQRVVDALSNLAFVEDASWRAHGLGDHVNASNLSRKKLGDVEFTKYSQGGQDQPNSISSVALEAHGGNLTKIYVENHLKTLAISVQDRFEQDWSKITDPEFCHVDVIYVAHSWNVDVPRERTQLSGIVVDLDYMNYDELKSRALASSSDEERLSCFNQWVLNVLNSHRVRQSVRNIAAEIMGDAVFLAADTK